MTATVKSLSKSRAAFFLVSIFLLFLFFRNAEIAAKAIGAGLRLCVNSLIPSLFPLMVASELLVAGGGVERLGNFLTRPADAIFGFRGDAACAVLLGMLCGFPIGTRCALTLYRDGRMSEDDFTRVLALSNHPSPAFLINTVGRTLLGSARTGVLLYLTTLTSSLLLAALLAPRKNKKSATFVTQAPSGALRARPTFSSALASAVSSSALSLLSICAFVLFFSALGECLTHLSASLSLSPIPTAILFGFFELTGGVVHAAECPTALAPLLCAFAVGFTGLSVHFQLFSLTGEERFSRAKYLLLKLAEGVLNLPIAALTLRALG